MAKKAQGKSVPGSVLVRILSLLEHQRLARLGLQNRFEMFLGTI